MHARIQLFMDSIIYMAAKAAPHQLPA